MDRLYTVPGERIDIGGGHFSRGPKYFHWKEDPDPPGIKPAGGYRMLYYGFQDLALIGAIGISQIDHDFLAAQSDVYVFPELTNLDDAIAPGDSLGDFHEAFNVPTNWTTPSTTYREFLRQMLGIFNFNQKYSRISAGQSLFDNHTLSTRIRKMSPQEEEWFYTVLDEYDIPRNAVNRNNTLRQVLKQGSDWLSGRTYALGGIVI